MPDYIVKNGKKLKKGYTTGTCACAASKAAALMLFTGEYISKICVCLPNEEKIFINIYDSEIHKDYVTCSVIKQSGDDPDVTDGIKIFSKVEKTKHNIEICGGNGIGKVTKDGLKIKKGSPAINPVPMEMIKREAEEICHKMKYTDGLKITISAPDGEKIAKNTFNERLGIIGGISILGTTGIVEPMSDNAIIETIKTEIEMLSKTEENILLTPGNYGKSFAETKFNLDFEKGIKYSNFIGEALDYSIYCNFKKILIIGHFGKLIKVAGGIMNTHSKIADCRMEFIGLYCALCKADESKIRKILNCITTDEALSYLENWNIKQKVLEEIKISLIQKLNYRIKNKADIEFIVFGKENEILFYSDKGIEFTKYFKKR